MRRIVLATVTIAGVVLLSIPGAEACGDKALRIGRGIRFQRPLHPAAVLIYIPSNSQRATQLQSMLKKVGHKSYAAPGAERLSEALRSGQYDLVLVDFAEAAGVEKQIGTSSSKPRDGAARKQYGNVVKNPHSADQYLDAIDTAMRSRVRLLAKKA